MLPDDCDLKSALWESMKPIQMRCSYYLVVCKGRVGISILGLWRSVALLGIPVPASTPMLPSILNRWLVFATHKITLAHVVDRLYYGVQDLEILYDDS